MMTHRSFTFQLIKSVMRKLNEFVSQSTNRRRVMKTAHEANLEKCCYEQVTEFQMEREVEEVFRMEALKINFLFDPKKKKLPPNSSFEIANGKKTPYITPSSVSMDQLPFNKRTKLKSLLESEEGRAKN